MRQAAPRAGLRGGGGGTRRRRGLGGRDPVGRRHFDVSQAMMPEGHGLRRLQMREARHHGGGVGLRDGLRRVGAVRGEGPLVAKREPVHGDACRGGGRVATRSGSVRGGARSTTTAHDRSGCP